MSLPDLAKPFPSVSYLAHSFHLLPHPHGLDRACVGKDGQPVTNETQDDWLLARRLGITASGFGQLVTKAGERSKSREKAIHAKVSGVEKDLSFVGAFELGREFEPVIAAKVESAYGVKANHWLLSHPDTPRFLATPDGLSSELVGEYKTSIKSWGSNLYSYYRQLQWQMFVTGRESSVFAVLHPHTGAFMAGIVPRDEAEMETLVRVSHEVLGEIDAYAEIMRASRFEEVEEDLWAPNFNVPF